MIFVVRSVVLVVQRVRRMGGSIVSDPAFFFVSILVFIVLFLVEGLDMKGGWSRYGYLYFLALIALDGSCAV